MMVIIKEQGYLGVTSAAGVSDISILLEPEKEYTLEKR